jgi:hypothetical protein
MALKNKFKEQLADIFVKVFQIVFAMLVVGMFLRDRFDFNIFSAGLLASLACLTVAVVLYYNATAKGEKK